MRRRSSILRPLSELSMERICAEYGSSMQDLGHERFYGLNNSMPFVGGSPATGSENTHHLILRKIEHLPWPYSNEGCVKNHTMSQYGHPQIGLQGNFSNHGYNWQPGCNHSVHPHIHPHRGLCQQASNSWKYMGYQPFLPPGLQAMPHYYGAPQPITNQRIHLKPYQLSNIDASLYAHHSGDELSRIFVPLQSQFNEHRAIQESQGPTKPGINDMPVIISEDDTEWLDSVYQKIQKCAHECLPDVIKIYGHFISEMSQSVRHNMPESEKLMAFWIEDMIELLKLQRIGLEHKVDQNVHKKINRIYGFTRRMRRKWSYLFVKAGEETKSDHGEQKTVPSAKINENHTHQKQDVFQQEAAAGSEAKSNVVSPLMPAETITCTQPIDPSDTVNQSKNIHQEPVSQSPPIDRLIKVLKEASPEALKSVARDVFAIISADDRIPEIPAYKDGWTYGYANWTTWENCNLNTTEMPRQRVKRNFNVTPVHIFSDTGGFIDSGSRMLNSPLSSAEKTKRQRVEGNKSLMNEIEFLNRKLLETQVVIIKPKAGLPTLAVSCTFTAAGDNALKIFSHLFPARMQLKIPRDYPQSQPTIKFCRHENCGQMCALLQMKYESWSKCCDMTCVKEIVLAWHSCAIELYGEICFESGGGSRSAIFDTWEKVSS